MLEKGEIADFEQFHLFPQCFPTAIFLKYVKMSIYGGKGDLWFFCYRLYCLCFQGQFDLIILQVVRQKEVYGSIIMW